MISSAEAKRADLNSVDILSSPKLKEARAIRELSRAFLELESRFVYGSISGEVLVLYFDHPGAVGEFEMKKSEILKRMREIYKEKGLKEVLIFRSIKAAFVQSRKKETQKQEQRADRAKGDFEIRVENPEIRRYFERIKEYIRADARLEDD